MTPLDVVVEGWQLRRYAFLLPVQGWSWQTTVTLHARDVIIGAEQRPMGVLLAKFTTSALSRNLPYAGVIGLVMGIACAGLLVLHGVRRRRWLIGVPSGLSMVLGVGGVSAAG
jgi:hypothetical protein